MKEEFEKLSLDYINICVKEALDANDNNLSKNQIAYVRKNTCDKIIEMSHKHGIEFVVDFLKERLSLTQK
jgi:hypothetical protein